MSYQKMTVEQLLSAHYTAQSKIDTAAFSDDEAVRKRDIEDGKTGVALVVAEFEQRCVSPDGKLPQPDGSEMYCESCEIVLKEGDNYTTCENSGTSECKACEESRLSLEINKHKLPQGVKASIIFYGVSPSTGLEVVFTLSGLSALPTEPIEQPDFIEVVRAFNPKTAEKVLELAPDLQAMTDAEIKDYQIREAEGE